MTSISAGPISSSAMDPTSTSNISTTETHAPPPPPPPGTLLSPEEEEVYRKKYKDLKKVVHSAVEELDHFKSLLGKSQETIARLKVNRR